MKRRLHKSPTMYHVVNGDVIAGPPPGVRGDLSGVWGDLTGVRGALYGVRGDLTGVWGDLTFVRGDLTCVWGELTGVRGSLGECELTDADRARGVDIEDLVEEETT